MCLGPCDQCFSHWRPKPSPAGRESCWSQMAFESSCGTHDWNYCLFILCEMLSKCLRKMEEHVLDEFLLCNRQIHFRSYYLCPWLGKHVFLERFPYSCYNFLGDVCHAYFKQSIMVLWLASWNEYKPSILNNLYIYNKRLMFINVFFTLDGFECLFLPNISFALVYNFMIIFSEPSTVVNFLGG